MEEVPYYSVDVTCDVEADYRYSYYYLILDEKHRMDNRIHISSSYSNNFLTYCNPQYELPYLSSYVRAYVDREGDRIAHDRENDVIDGSSSNIRISNVHQKYEKRYEYRVTLVYNGRKIEISRNPFTGTISTTYQSRYTKNLNKCSAVTGKIFAVVLFLAYALVYIFAAADFCREGLEFLKAILAIVFGAATAWPCGMLCMFVDIDLEFLVKDPEDVRDWARVIFSLLGILAIIALTAGVGWGVNWV